MMADMGHREMFCKGIVRNMAKQDQITSASPASTIILLHVKQLLTINALESSSLLMPSSSPCGWKNDNEHQVNTEDNNIREGGRIK